VYGLAELVERILEGPYEILELAPCETKTLRVVDWQVGKMRIRPKWMPIGEFKEILAVRIHVPKEDKPIFPHYWDLTPRTLVAQLLPILTEGVPEGYGIRIHAVGYAPKKRFEVGLVKL